LNILFQKSFSLLPSCDSLGLKEDSASFYFTTGIFGKRWICETMNSVIKEEIYREFKREDRRNKREDGTFTCNCLQNSFSCRK